MSEFDASVLFPGDRLKQLVLDEEMTQIHRGDAYAEEGDTFEIDGQTFEITDVTQRTLGDLTEADARAQGAEDLDAYRERLKRAHQDFEWDDDSETVRHAFEPVDD
ncbi:hypothetical protein SAMN05216559_4211 [Halomicrobium zhouii]|uniref:ASCH domain-containing protein n=1 Tax=Halomicrobium zhouii TaxID=767519 RepID=A0A1I6MC53_9EURY|nr:hypothetical protein [Halomicrobium zhouii]SFS13158.1 hypothetical protein SAMN05216559_4211 [Halomicrobium zhouii]